MSSTTELSPRDAKFVSLRDLLRKKERDILAALPRHLTPAYFMRVVLTCLQRNRGLLDCEPISFLGAVLQCAQLGLVPDGFLGHAYLIPYANNKRRPPREEVQFQPGYRGLITLARRSGEISIIHAAAVHERDKFEYECGFDPHFSHTPDDSEDPGRLVKTYAFYRLKDGGRDLLVMNAREVHAIRSRSQAYNAGLRSGRHDSPWFTDEAWMWKKTVLKQLLKTAPLSIEIERAAALDDRAESGLPQDLGVLADDNETPTPEEPEGGGDVDPLPEAQPARKEPQRKSAQPAEPPPGELLTAAEIPFSGTPKR